jgi:hypothetical protein
MFAAWKALPLAVLLAFPVSAAAAPGLPMPVPVLQKLLQRFVDSTYLKAFRHLGDERDFDHGHLLYDDDGRPVAVLYHTQELAHYAGKGTPFAYIDRGARNWIQWLDDGRVENAARYARRDYPRSPSWDWFRAQELPALREHHTILDKMLDPALLGFTPARSRQWVFTRGDCSTAAARVRLPGAQDVCLALSAS